jgi:cytochrome c-type biogenesis protein
MDIFSLLIPAFISGLLTFFAPCTLPLVPAYLAFISGISTKDLGNIEYTGNVKARVFLNGVFFVLGFSFVFILLGLFAGAIGSFFLLGKVWFAKIGGIAVVLLGLMMLEIVPVPSFLLNSNIKVNLDNKKRGTYGVSFLLGVVFGSGWTPCIGPVLGSILIFASKTGNLFSGAFILSVYSLGLAIPFLFIALGVERAQKLVDNYSKHLWIIQKVGGVVIVFLGILLFLDKMYFLTNFGFEIFDFMNYDSLIKYL